MSGDLCGENPNQPYTPDICAEPSTGSAVVGREPPLVRRLNHRGRQRMRRYIDQLIDVAARGNAPHAEWVLADIERFFAREDYLKDMEWHRVTDGMSELRRAR